MRSWWKVVRDGFAQRREIVERHCGEHVVLHMILHVPIEKPDERTAGESAAAEPEIRCVGHQTDMLWRPAERHQPTTIENREVDQENQDPLADGDEYGGQGQMTKKHDTGPIAVASTKFLILFG